MTETIEQPPTDAPRSDTHSPILVIDSSLAGLGVVRALRDRLPDERFVFFGDLARAPYAHRSPDRVCRFVEQICHHVDSIRPKHVLLTCDVAGSTAAAALRERLGEVAVTNTIDPAARAAVEVTGHLRCPTIGVFAGHWTIEHRTLERAIVRRRTKCYIYSRATPSLEALVNEGRSIEDPLVRLAARQYVEQLVRKGCDVILLASTPLASIRRLIQAIAGEHVKVVDATRATAEDVARRLGRRRMLNMTRPLTEAERELEWFLSDDSPEIFDRAERLAGAGLPRPTVVGLDELEPISIAPRELRQAG